MAITLKTDRQGLAIVDKARVHKNWTALAAAWCTQANVSVSTLKRFRERKAIQKDAFIAICQAVGIQEWESVVAGASQEISVLRRSYRQSKKLIAEEVLSNLTSLDARLDFVEQVFADDPHAVKQETCRQRRMASDAFPTSSDGNSRGRHRRPPTSPPKNQPIRQSINHSKVSKSTTRCPLVLEANVSIIQILMDV
ncbi:MAG: hypothetical protein AAFQ40_10445 [Cyanobacteria bacterium J06623_5]